MYEWSDSDGGSIHTSVTGQSDRVTMTSSICPSTGTNPHVCYRAVRPSDNDVKYMS